MPAPQLTAHKHLAGCINAMDLKDRLGDIETDCRNRLHRELLQIVGASNSAHILGTLVPLEEPSTASIADIATVSIPVSTATAKPAMTPLGEVMSVSRSFSADRRGLHCRCTAHSHRE